MTPPKPGQIFELSVPPIFNTRLFGTQIHAEQDWRCGKPTNPDNEFENFDGVEDEPIGLVKYHEIKSFSGIYVNISTDCYDAAFSHWLNREDTLFWLWKQFSNGHTYQFEGLIPFSAMLEHRLIRDSHNRAAYYMIAHATKTFMLDL